MSRRQPRLISLIERSSHQLSELPTLSEVLQHPEQVTRLPAKLIPPLLMQLTALHTALVARLLETVSPDSHSVGTSIPPGRLLSPEDAAQRMGVTVDWLYRHGDQLPFTRRLGRKTLKWQQVLERFEPAYMLGLTASTVRGDGRCIAEPFTEIIYFLDPHCLIRRGRFVDAVGWRVRTNVDLSDIPLSSNGDYQLPTLAHRVNTVARNRHAIEADMRVGEGKPCIAFCADIAHAEAVAEEARRRCLRAAAVHGHLSKRERRGILNMFKRGLLDIVTNCDALTEGYNNPQVTVVLLLRPYTQRSARVLLIQSVGRALRIALGKLYAIVVELIDCERSAYRGSLDDVFGSPLGNCQGTRLSEFTARQHDLQDRQLASAIIDELRAHVLPLCGAGYTRPVPAEAWKRFDAIAYVEEVSGLNWIRLGAGRIYLNLGSQPDPGDPSRSVARVAEIRQTTGGVYAATLREGQRMIPLAVRTSEGEALAAASWQLLAQDDSGLGVARSRATWRRGPASPGQCALLGRLSRLPASVFARMDQGRASDLISALQGTRLC